MRQGHEPLSGAQCPIKGVEGGGGMRKVYVQCTELDHGHGGKIKKGHEPQSSAQCPIMRVVGGN